MAFVVVTNLNIDKKFFFIYFFFRFVSLEIMIKYALGFLVHHIYSDSSASADSSADSGFFAFAGRPRPEDHKMYVFIKTQ